MTHGNGVVETWANDANSLRRSRSISATGPAGLAGSWNLGGQVYDGTGNITKIGSAWFTYDKVNRLTAGTIYTAPMGGGTGTQQGYNRVGQRLGI